MNKRLPQTNLLWNLPGIGLTLFLFMACTNAPAPGHAGGTEATTSRRPCPHSGGEPLPFMWVEKDKSSRRQSNFILKDYLLTNALQAQYPNKKETDSIDYPINSFKGMITYFASNSSYREIDVWLAAYSDDGTPSVPAGLGNTLTIVFTPINSVNAIDGYYTLPPGTQGFNILSITSINRILVRRSTPSYS